MVLTRLRYEADNFKYENGYDIPIHVLAGKLRNLAQLISQYAFYRTLCTSTTWTEGIATILMGIDDEKGPQIFKIDPAGRCEGFRGCTAGQKDQEAMTLLEKAYKKKAQSGGAFSLEEATETVIETLQNVIGADFKAPDVEVAVLTTADPSFRLLQPVDVERFLNRIADKS